MLTHLQPERGVRICERRSPVDTKVNEEGEGGGTPGTGAEGPVVKTMVMQAVPLQPMEVIGGADIYLQPMENSTPEQVGVPKEAVTPWEMCTGVGSWHDLLMLEQVCWQD
ncbi:protein pxr1-like [Limosa lapponica baueri]|uniref:Protein pxr1-like n=1 Tax=Limosa lapponica baueri TaxID=1758121 RepID=A0A2I0UMX1_LIMLA|nr:protein pxr1-like [Limosa lapponica baueri]